MKIALNVLSASVLLAMSVSFASNSAAQPQSVVTTPTAAASAQTQVASAAPVAVVTVETVKDINQIPVADQQPTVKKQRPSHAVREKITAYVKSKGIVIATNQDGKTFYDGYATVKINRASPDYGKALAMAYQEAYMAALAKFAEQLEQTVADRLERDLFTDSSTNAREFAAEPGQSKIQTLIDKGLELAGAKLDDALRKLGTTEAQIKSLSPAEKKTLYKNSILQTTVQHASLALGGINIQQNFIESDEKGNAAVGVLIAYSPKMASVAESLARGEKPLIRAVGQPLEELLPLNEPEKLAQNFGPRLLIDSYGPVIVSFGLWSSSYTGTDDVLADQYEQAALRQANADANAQVARFLSVSFTTDSEATRGASAERYVEKDKQTGRAGADIAKNIITDRLSEQSVAQANARLSGVETLKEWTWQMPEGQLLVGVVKAYRFAGIENARKILEGPQEETQPEPQPQDQNPVGAISSQGSVESSLDVF